MRRAERRPADRARARSQHARRRVHPGHLQRRLLVQRRQQTGQPPRQHRLADAGRADHEHVVPADRGELERAARERLAAHVGEIGRVRGHGAASGLGLRQRELSAQPGHDLRQMASAVHRQAADERGLRGARTRADERLEANAPGRLGCDQRAVHRTQAPVECELAQHEHLPRSLARELIARRQDRDRHRKVVPRPELGDVAWREVDHDTALRPPQLARDDACAHALPRLADGAVGQAYDDRGAVLAPADAGLHLHELAFDADRRLAVGGRDHEARLGVILLRNATDQSNLRQLEEQRAPSRPRSRPRLSIDVGEHSGEQPAGRRRRLRVELFAALRRSRRPRRRAARRPCRGACE